MASVLIVEDQDSLRVTLSRFLGRLGHRVSVAASGRRALESALACRPEVLVTDWLLKNHIHGLHVSETMKALVPGLQTILITGFPSRDLAEESGQQGVVQLLEKPFELSELQDAIDRALGAGARPARARPIAAVEIEADGSIRSSSAHALELFATCEAGRDASSILDLLEPGGARKLVEAMRDWTHCAPRLRPDAEAAGGWLLRGRDAAEGERRLVVILPEAEHARVQDPRIEVLLESNGRSRRIQAAHRPVVVIERDLAMRRLLVSQIERIGTVCYPADDLDSALRLLAEEPRVATVLLDVDQAGSELPHWLAALREGRPDAVVIAIGGGGDEQELIARGVSRVLPRPWRLVDLLDAMTG